MINVNFMMQNKYLAKDLILRYLRVNMYKTRYDLTEV